MTQRLKKRVQVNVLLQVKLVGSLLALLGCGHADSSSGSMKDFSPPERTVDGAYIDNGIVRLGIDPVGGGSIFYCAESKTGRNLLNHYDFGRFVQQSYYGDEDGSEWNGQPWRWNPIQGGDYQHTPARVLESEILDESIVMTSVPRHWASGEEVSEAKMSQKIELVGPVVKINYVFEYFGEKSHEARHQEMPAVFVDYDLLNLVLYNGDAPWTGGELTDAVPGWPNEAHFSTENWAAYVDDNGWGLGVYFPGTTELTAYRYKGDGTAGPKGSACSYFAPHRTYGIAPGHRTDYNVYITIGTIEEIRQRFAELRESGNSFTTN